MSRFNAHFSFKRSWVEPLFNASERLKSTQGLRLLQAPVSLVPATEAAVGKLLVVVPRRVGKAVIRNRIRRCIKALVYEHHLLIPQTMYILIVGPRALTHSPAQLLVLLKKILAPTPQQQPNELQTPIAG